MAAIDYKQKIKDYMNSSEVDTLYKSMLNNLFPELAESENIKIIKAIKYGLDHVFTNNTTVFEVTKEQCLSWLEKQGEQKPADKVSLNFNKGDILYEQKTMSILLVYERNGSWLMTFCDYWMLKEKLHIEFPYENYGFVQEMSLVPATKEQRNLLFQKTKEAGYEWDAEKKELKKIEQKPKSTWKPSDEQMKALDFYIKTYVDTEGCYGSEVLELYEQLKKLRGE